MTAFYPLVHVNRSTRGSLARDVIRDFHMCGSTRETLLCKRNIVQTRMVGRKEAVVAAAVHAAVIISITTTNSIATSFFK